MPTLVIVAAEVWIEPISVAGSLAALSRNWTSFLSWRVTAYDDGYDCPLKTQISPRNPFDIFFKVFIRQFVLMTKFQMPTSKAPF
jgi:hypothetical protein